MDPMHKLELVQSILFVLGLGIVAYSPIAQAIGRRIMHGKTPPPGAPSLDEHRVEDLSGEVASLRQLIEEQQERLDFTERVIAQVKEKASLPSGR